MDREVHRPGQPLLLLLRGRRLRPVLPQVLLLLFPCNAKLCLNGNHWAQHQAAKAGIGFTPLDNAFASVDDPVGLQQICDRLGPDQINALLDKWLAILPGPFADADRGAGYRYEISVLQAEFSLTQMLDQPVTGRMFFEQVIRDNLGIGRPDQVSLVFDRHLVRRGSHPTPGRFRWASNDSTTTRSREPATCTPSPTRSPPLLEPASQACAWASNAATHYCPRC